MSPVAITQYSVKNPVELVALDLDGTCLDPQTIQPTNRTKDAIRAAATSGKARIVLATGRMYRSALRWANEFNITEPIICYQGAQIRALPDAHHRLEQIPLGELWFSKTLSGDVAVAALAVARMHNWHRVFFYEERLLCEQDRPEAKKYAGQNTIPMTFVEDLQSWASKGTPKIVCVVEDPIQAELCEQTMRAHLQADAHITRSSPDYIEITAPGISKGNALRKLCARFEIWSDNVVAIGDAPNDLEMLEYAGVAVAVEGSPQALLEVADVTCPQPKDSGVAVVLEKLGLI